MSWALLFAAILAAAVFTLWIGGSWRAALTQRLIREQGFSFDPLLPIVVEPGASRELPTHPAGR